MYNKNFPKFISNLITAFIFILTLITFLFLLSSTTSSNFPTNSSDDQNMTQKVPIQGLFGSYFSDLFKKLTKTKFSRQLKPTLNISPVTFEEPLILSNSTNTENSKNRVK